MSNSSLFERKIAPAGGFGPLAGGRKVAGLTAPFRLLCAARYGQLGASSRLRLAQYRPALEQAGIRTTLRAFLPDDYIRALYRHKSRFWPVASAYVRAFGIKSEAGRHDLLWIEKELLPWLPYWLERRAIGKTPYVLDFDDAWSLRYERSGSRLIRYLLGRKFSALLQGAALTITGNEYLYEWAKREGAQTILLLPTVIDLEHYEVAPEPEGAFTVCWVGTPLTAKYLQNIAAPLQALAAEAPLRLLIIGAPETEIEGVACEHADWDETTEAADIARCHAGIMPLPDDEWARGKSGYKLIQYMAMGRPAVASPVGANRGIVEDGRSGFLAADNAEWFTALRRLRDDAALRAAMGAAARARVEQDFCLQVTAPVLINALKEAVAG
jgi:glycosyltransferase involved in cell wall biosynthesis